MTFPPSATFSPSEEGIMKEKRRCGNSLEILDGMWGKNKGGAEGDAALRRYEVVRDVG